MKIWAKRYELTRVGAIGNTWKLEEQLGVTLGAIRGTLRKHGGNTKIQNTKKTQNPIIPKQKTGPSSMHIEPTGDIRGVVGEIALSLFLGCASFGLSFFGLPFLSPLGWFRPLIS